MKLSLEWLRDFISLEISPDEAASKLTMIGFEVESVEQTGGDSDRLVAARIQKIKPHPSADKLKICEVFNGAETIELVCGAPNAREGLISIWASQGTKLPGGRIIEEAVIRGMRSEGMLCSLQELGLEEYSAGIHEFSSDVRPGTKAAPLVGLANDYILEVGITPNRGDALSYEGIAREIAAAFGVGMKKASGACAETNRNIGDIASLRILDPIGCPRYAARIIEGVKIGPSPAWMKKRLNASGIRAINNIVDITNYVMIEVGQPLHAFDLDRLAGPGIVVRRSKKGEKFVTLDGVERLLDNDLLICDVEKPVALAGVMGGLNSEVIETTTSILLESACFDPAGIRRTSKRIGLSSEASYRFERGVDPCLQLRAANRAAALMAEYAGGKIASGALDDSNKFPAPPQILLKDDRVRLYLGMELSRSESKKLLESIEIEVKDSRDGLIASPPSWRGDISEEADIIEEIARLYGYEKLPVTLPEGRPAPVSANPDESLSIRIRDALVGAGYHQIISLSFMNPSALDWLRIASDDEARQMVMLLNPLSSEESALRTTLLPNLLNTVAYNLRRLQDDIRLFEIGKVFLAMHGAPLPNEPMSVAGAMVASRSKQLHRIEVNPFLILKGAVEEVLSELKISNARFERNDLRPYLLQGENASIIIDNERVGSLGRLKPSVAASFDISEPVYIFELDFPKMLSYMSVETRFKAIPVYPPAFRDVAILVNDETPAAELEEAIKRVNSEVIHDVRIFDVYRGSPVPEGYKSVAFSIVYQWPDRSPNDEQVNEIHSEISKILENKFGAKIR